MTSFKELGFFARGMIMVLFTGREYIITNIRDENGNEYELCFFEDADEKRVFLELNHTEYLFTDDLWVKFPKEIICKNAEDFIGKSIN